MIVELFKNLFHQGVDCVKTDHLYDFDGVPGYSLGCSLGQDQWPAPIMPAPTVGIIGAGYWS